MTDFGDRSSNRYREEIKDVPCPICGKAHVRVTFVAGLELAEDFGDLHVLPEERILVIPSCEACPSRPAAPG
ncbi:MAG: hypothetical protein KKA90_05000 [Nanoarchaeota archaeon]|nr:hypothetical protein [Nanoarchaeota archaeon]